MEPVSSLRQDQLSASFAVHSENPLSQYPCWLQAVSASEVNLLNPRGSRETLAGLQVFLLPIFLFLEEQTRGIWMTSCKSTLINSQDLGFKGNAKLFSTVFHNFLKTSRTPSYKPNTQQMTSCVCEWGRGCMYVHVMYMCVRLFICVCSMVADNDKSILKSPFEF